MFPRPTPFSPTCPLDEGARAAAMTSIVLAIVMLAAFALVAGAFALWRRTGDAKNPALMVLLAVIAIVNVLIWTVPTDTGEAPVDQIGKAAEGN